MLFWPLAHGQHEGRASAAPEVRCLCSDWCDPPAGKAKGEPGRSQGTTAPRRASLQPAARSDERGMARHSPSRQAVMLHT